MHISIKRKLHLLEEIPKKKCRYCKSKVNLTYDHKIPLSKGGTSDIKNIQVLCEDCNKTKSSLSHGEVMRLFKWFRKIQDKKFPTGQK